MKSFSFRLDRVLRWRETQLRLAEARVAAAAGRVAGVQGALKARREELKDSRAQIAANPASAALVSFDAYTGRAARELKQLQEHGFQAQKKLAAELDGIRQANRKVKLLENLEQSQRDAWQREFDRETAAFADEAYLSRLQPARLQSKGGSGA